jgi:predicted ArsR family transcriptional regulator
LVDAGFVVRTIERLPGRGRPRHLYAAPHSALLLLFANNQHLVVPAIWRAIDEVGGLDLSKKILRRVSSFLADHYRAKVVAKEPKERLAQLMRVIEEEGGLVEVVRKNGRVTVSKRSCAFISMFDESRTVCALELDMMSAVVGAPVNRVACRHDGDPCCSFEVALDQAEGPVSASRAQCAATVANA